MKKLTRKSDDKPKRPAKLQAIWKYNKKGRGRITGFKNISGRKLKKGEPVKIVRGLFQMIPEDKDEEQPITPLWDIEDEP